MDLGTGNTGMNPVESGELVVEESNHVEISGSDVGLRRSKRLKKFSGKKGKKGNGGGGGIIGLSNELSTEPQKLGSAGNKRKRAGVSGGNGAGGNGAGGEKSELEKEKEKVVAQIDLINYRHQLEHQVPLSNLNELLKLKYAIRNNEYRIDEFKHTDVVDGLQHVIDTKTLQSKNKYVDKLLELQERKEILKLTTEVDDYELTVKKKKLQEDVAILKLQGEVDSLRDGTTKKKIADEVANTKNLLELRELEEKMNLISNNKAIRSMNPALLVYLNNYSGNNSSNGSSNSEFNKFLNNYTRIKYYDLTISDRVVNLSYVITSETAEYVSSAISFYNNVDSSLPIFLMIDMCCGGSVMAGFQIMQSMKSSFAPIYVIVKSYAASMAATILTISEHSYVFPNAFVLHHMAFGSLTGNKRQTEEQKALADESHKRLEQPLIDRINERILNRRREISELKKQGELLKQGFVNGDVSANIDGYTWVEGSGIVNQVEEKGLELLDLNKWDDLLYKHNSEGDWMLYGDKAVELFWAKGVVHRLRETGQIKHPDTDKTETKHSKKHHKGRTCSNHENDDSGHHDNCSMDEKFCHGLEIDRISGKYILPRLLPNDRYMIHDLQNRFIIQNN